MQDFLQDRPVLTPETATIIAPAQPAEAKGNGGPFARIVRDTSVAAAAQPAGATAPTAGGATANPAAAHASEVKTIMENGRIARLIVTCSCGKVTEIACTY